MFMNVNKLCVNQTQTPSTGVRHPSFFGKRCSECAVTTSHEFIVTRISMTSSRVSASLAKTGGVFRFALGCLILFKLGSSEIPCTEAKNALNFLNSILNKWHFLKSFILRLSFWALLPLGQMVLWCSQPFFSEMSNNSNGCYCTTKPHADHVTFFSHAPNNRHQKGRDLAALSSASPSDARKCNRHAQVSFLQSAIWMFLFTSVALQGSNLAYHLTFCTCP